MAEHDDGQHEDASQVWLRQRLMAAPLALWTAAEIVRRSGGERGYLAARQYLDRQLSDQGHEPHDADYRGLAAEFAAAGRPGEAAVLDGVGRASETMLRARDRWKARYEHRPRTWREAAVDRLLRTERINFDPGAPYRGLDGAQYEAGMAFMHAAVVPVLLITTRGMREAITGWDSYREMREWLSSRGSSEAGAFTWPGPAARSRTAREEMVLARWISCPWENRGLGPSAFTADVRHDLYLAILSAAASPENYTAARVMAAFRRQAEMAPPDALDLYGGDRLLVARLYIARLAAAKVPHERAASAAVAIREEDGAQPQRDGSAMTPGRLRGAAEASGLDRPASRMTQQPGQPLPPSPEGPVHRPLQREAREGEVQGCGPRSAEGWGHGWPVNGVYPAGEEICDDTLPHSPPGGATTRQSP